MEGNRASSLDTNHRFRQAVGRVLIALSFKSRGKAVRSHSDGFDDVTKNCAKQQVPEQREPLSQPTGQKQTKRSPAVNKVSNSVTNCKTTNKENGSNGKNSTIRSTLHAEEDEEEEESRRPDRHEFGSSSQDLGDAYPGDLLSEKRVPLQPRAMPRRVAPPPLIKRNTIADFVSTRAYQAAATLVSTTPGSEQEKKTKSTFSLLKLIDKKANRSKESLSQLNDVLQNLKQSEFIDHGLALYKDGHWLKVFGDSEPEEEMQISKTERKRREAVWELLTSECVFLFDHLMVLKHCFMEPLKKIQSEGYLVSVDPKILFGNLDELCHVSYTFCYDFIQLLLRDAKMADFGKTEVLLHGLRRFSELTRDGEVYHDYCLNYSDAMTYLEKLRKNEEFCEYEKWCEQDLRCHRLQLADLLICPMQHCTKVPLLLNHVRLYTLDPQDQETLSQSLEKLEDSLRKLNLKMSLMRNLERVRQIQRQIAWPLIMDLEPRTSIPEFLRVLLSGQRAADILCDRQRHLIYEGPVTLNEISFKPFDAYFFLFDDVLLMTKVKKPQKKRLTPPDNSYTYWNPKFQPEAAGGGGAGIGGGGGETFVVHKQPITLDSLIIHDVKQSDATANGLKNVFVLLNVNRFQQVVGVYTIQTTNETAKTVWLHRIRMAQERHRERQTHQNQDSNSNDGFIDSIPPTYLSISSWNPYRDRCTTSGTQSPGRLSPSLTVKTGATSSNQVAPPSGSDALDLPAMPRARANSDLSHSDGDVYFTKKKCGRAALEESDALRRQVAVSNTTIDRLLEKDVVSCDDPSRVRPSSFHSKRHIPLKAIREKSLSVDLPTAVNVHRLH